MYGEQCLDIQENHSTLEQTPLTAPGMRTPLSIRTLQTVPKVMKKLRFCKHAHMCSIDSTFELTFVGVYMLSLIIINKPMYGEQCWDEQGNHSIVYNNTPGMRMFGTL